MAEPQIRPPWRFNRDIWRKLIDENREIILEQYRTESGKEITPHQLSSWAGHSHGPKLLCLQQIADICGVTDMSIFWT